MSIKALLMAAVLCGCLTSGVAVAAERRALITGIRSPAGMIYDKRVRCMWPNGRGQGQPL